MNAVERIEKAIERLERLKQDTTPGPWERKDSYGHPGGTGVAIWHSPYLTFRANAGTEANAELIVTLHRTIDAQLAILRAAVATYKASYAATQGRSPGIDVPPGVHYMDPAGADRTASYHVRRELALADAILGGETNG